MPIRKHPHIIRNILIGLLGFVICGGLVYFIFAAVVASAVRSTFGNSCDPSNPTLVENFAGIKLPPSAKNLQSDCGGTQGWRAEASFEMNPSDLTVFVVSTRVKPPLSSTGKPAKLNCTLYCKQSSAITSYLYGTSSQIPWPEEIFIDTTNPERYIVYFTVLGG